MATKKTTKSKKQESEEVITAYKGFDQDLKCRNFQYEIGGEYTHKGAVQVCKSGFHACEHPLNVFDYYSPGGSRFAVVELSGDLSREGGDTKVASRRIKIKAEIGIVELVKAAIEYVTARCSPVDPDSPASATGRHGAAMAAGVDGKAKGAEGCALFLVYRDIDACGDEHGRILHAKAVIVGRDGIQSDTWYRLNKEGEIEIAD